jgi:hypothetical protein
MSLVDNYADVAFASEYAIDKIVGVFTGSFNAATQTSVIAGYLYQYSFAHAFKRPVFCELLWSTDGVTYADGGSGILSSTQGIAYADSSNIYVTTGLNVGTIYYKVLCSWIDDFDTTDPLITPVLNTTSNFYFDTRSNYQKIYHQDVGTVTGISGTVNYIHGLGRRPNFKVFFESVTGQVWPAIAGGVNDFFLYDPSLQYECAATITSSTLSMALQGGASSVSARVWFRIYLDS